MTLLFCNICQGVHYRRPVFPGIEFWLGKGDTEISQQIQVMIGDVELSPWTSNKHGVPC